MNDQPTRRRSISMPKRLGCKGARHGTDQDRRCRGSAATAASPRVVVVVVAVTGVVVDFRVPAGCWPILDIAVIGVSIMIAVTPVVTTTPIIIVMAAIISIVRTRWRAPILESNQPYTYQVPESGRLSTGSIVHPGQARLREEDRTLLLDEGRVPY